jgi:hypothetical protein
MLFRTSPTRLFQCEPGTLLQQVIRALAMTIVNDFGALQLLAQYGFGADAAKIARTMFGAAVNIAYLRRNPDKLDNFMDYYSVAAKSMYEDLKSVDAGAAASLPPDDVRETLERFEQIEHRFTDKRSWTKDNLFERAKSVGTTAEYLVLYKTLSGFIHSDVRAICRSEVEPSPSIRRHQSTGSKSRWITARSRRCGRRSTGAASKIRRT